MKILVVNDDGINSVGLKALVQKLLKYDYEIMIVAPTIEQSASSHALTLRRGLNKIKHPDMFKGIPTYSIDGSPADCVKFAYHALSFDFDLVLSGVNDGLNMGDDIMYSGTVAGASEAGFLGKKGIALSCMKNDLTGFELGFDRFWELFLKSKLFSEANVFNINFPKQIKGIKITHQGYNPFNTIFEKGDDNLYYSKGHSQYLESNNTNSSDIKAYHEGYISVTPLTLNRTDKSVFNKYLNQEL